MRYLLIITILAASCHSAHKSTNELQQKIKNTFLSGKDSAGHVTIDSSRVTGIATWGKIIIDTNYDKVTEEVIKETVDSNTTRREIVRTIKEKGQKRVEQSTTTIKNDSTGKKINQGATVTQLQKKDSSASISITNKDVKRESFLPWWIWLIAIIAVIILIWSYRNPIIKFFYTLKDNLC